MDDDEDAVVLASTESPRLHRFGPDSTASLRFRNYLVTSCTSFILKSVRATVAHSANSTGDSVQEDATTLGTYFSSILPFQPLIE
jgi:hypothetical protein